MPVGQEQKQGEVLSLICLDEQFAEIEWLQNRLLYMQMNSDSYIKEKQEL